MIERAPPDFFSLWEIPLLHGCQRSNQLSYFSLVKLSIKCLPCNLAKKFAEGVEFAISRAN